MPSIITEDNRYHPEQNALFAALPAEELQQIERDLELVSLSLGEVLHESDETMSHAYFPIDCVASMLYVMENGESAEIAVVGNEGLVGTPLFMGGHSTKGRAIVQNAGHAYRLKGEVLRQKFEQRGALSHLLLMYVSALITQMIQTAACNRHHSVEQQLCRWILMTMDRLPTERIVMTSKLIGNMLGIKPDDAEKATRTLEDAGLVTYDEGKITILDRPGIEARSCECYSVVSSETRRLLPLSIEVGQR